MAEPSPGGGNKPAIDIGAGAAGLGGGTFLAALANNLSDDRAAKSWLILIAPAATITIRYLWANLRFQLDEYWLRRSRKKRFEANHALLLRFRNRPNAGAAYRREMDERIKQLERDFLDQATK